MDQAPRCKLCQFTIQDNLHNCTQAAADRLRHVRTGVSEQQKAIHQLADRIGKLEFKIPSIESTQDSLTHLRVHFESYKQNINEKLKKQREYLNDENGVIVQNQKLTLEEIANLNTQLANYDHYTQRLEMIEEKLDDYDKQQAKLEALELKVDTLEKTAQDNTELKERLIDLELRVAEFLVKKEKVSESPKPYVKVNMKKVKIEVKEEDTENVPEPPEVPEYPASAASCEPIRDRKTLVAREENIATNINNRSLGPDHPTDTDLLEIQISSKGREDIKMTVHRNTKSHTIARMVKEQLDIADYNFDILYMESVSMRNCPTIWAAGLRRRQVNYLVVVLPREVAPWETIAAKLEGKGPRQ